MIFGALLRTEDGPLSSGDDPLHLLRVAAERRGTFAGIEDTEPPRRSRADIKETATLTEGRLDEADDRGDLVPAAGHGVGNRAVFGVHQVDDLDRRREIDGRRPRVALLGDAEFLPFQRD